MVAMGLGCARILAVGQEQVDYALEVAPVWAGHPVGFALLTRGTNQYVAFYDTNRQMTVAWRGIPSREWTLQKLDSRVGWDSHNYITMALDANECLHVSGNMHVNPLVYFQSTRPRDITSLQRMPSLVGDREKRTTYPRFLRGPGGELVFTYRDGQSGNGDQILDVYDARSHKWKRLLDTPLFGGLGKMNAYYSGPEVGPDQYYHICWVWRNTPDCSSNHDLSYARSRDLIHWETSAGKPVPVPITLATGEIVDPVPTRGGLLNGNTRVGFDSRGRTIISYHKHDANGFTQIYCARLEEGRWKQYQVSDWDYHWEFNGGGTIIAELTVGNVTWSEGQLTLPYGHAKKGGGVWVLDEATLKPTGKAQRANPFGRFDKDSEVTFPGLQFRSASDLGAKPTDGSYYTLRWQTLGANRDRPREGPLPPPTSLRLFKVTGANK